MALRSGLHALHVVVGSRVVVVSFYAVSKIGSFVYSVFFFQAMISLA